MLIQVFIVFFKLFLNTKNKKIQISKHENERRQNIYLNAMELFKSAVE